MARKKKKEEHHGGERWAVPYADFLSLLLALFIALFAISSLDQKKLASFVEAFSVAFSFKPIVEQKAPFSIIEGKGTKEKKEQLRRQLKTRVENLIASLNLKDKVQVEYVPQGLRIRILDYVIFDPCSTIVKDDYQQLLLKLASLFEQIEFPIQIEGHTDSLPPGPGCMFPSNWELSASRAASIARFMIANSSIDSKRFVVVGYADTHPIAPNISPQGRILNRRIEITILMGMDQESASVQNSTSPHPEQGRP